MTSAVEIARSCVHVLFEAQVARAPDAIALVYEHGNRLARNLDASFLSYAELHKLSNQLARRLQELGVSPDTRVAIALDRSPELIVALLATLKAGGTYLPLDTKYPPSRTEFMLKDGAAKVIVTQESLRDSLPEATVPIISMDGDASSLGALSDGPVESAATPEHLAYVLYTSGSTGQSKGVAVPHRAVTRLVTRAIYANLGPECAILMAAPVTFDASTFEIWGALLNGGRVVLHSELVPSACGVGRSIEQFEVTTMWLTSALFNAIVDENPARLAGLRQLLIGGEALSVPHIRRALTALTATEIVNCYGPTETTTFATYYRIPRAIDADTQSIPIGRAIGGTHVYVLDTEGRHVAPGALGELHIGGEGVARGYLGRPELTAQRFLEDPRQPAALMFASGDLVRLRADGELDFVGRIDDQIKLRGYRIELGEIEVALVKHISVRQAAVKLCHGPRGKYLVAYTVCLGPERPTAPDLMEFLRQSLPEYMVPSRYFELAALPLTPNGKLDRLALPDPDESPSSNPVTTDPG